MKIFLTILCIGVSTLTYAQKAPVKFGDIPLDDMKMVKYPLDTSASAVVLTDFGESELKYSESQGFQVQFDRILRIKILKKEGLDWATISVPVYHEESSDEKFSGLRASTFNMENGKVVETKMKNDATFREKVNENIDVIKFTLPNVRQGSVIEVSYHILSDFLGNFQDWDFQRSIPTRWSEYRAIIPEFFHYEKFMQGYVQLASAEDTEASRTLTFTNRTTTVAGPPKTSYDDIHYLEHRHRWVAKDVPAFVAEPFMTTSKDFISRINFELAYTKFPNQPVKPFMGTWEDITRKFNDSQYFGGLVTGSGYLKKIVEDVTAGKTTPEEKIAAINNYVRQNVEWNGRSQKWVDGNLRSALDAKKGSSAEVNLLLASMLEKAGIDVSPVLISTRDNGFVRETVPVSSQFNYVICVARVGDKKILLDATDPLLPVGVLPQRCLNGHGLVISKLGPNWIPLASGLRSKDVNSADLVLSADGELKGKIQFEHSGYFARECRKSYLVKGETEYLKSAIADRPWTIEKSEFVNAKNTSETFKEIYQVSITDHVASAGETIYLNPFLNMQEKENPFKSATREYPVDFGSPIEKLYLCKIAIPEGYVVDEMPKPRILKLGDNAAKYTYTAVQSGNVISLTSHFLIFNSMFPQTEYEHLREFYNIIVAKQSEQIVLKKKP